MKAHGGGDLVNRMTFWDLEHGTVRSVAALSDNVRTLALDPGRGVLFVGGGWNDPLAEAWDIATGSRLGRFVGHHEGVGTIMLAADRRLATVSLDRTVRIWTREPRHTPRAVHLGFDCRELAVGPDRARAAYCSQDGHVYLLDLDTMETRMDLTLEHRRQSSEYAALLGDRVFTVGWDGVLRVIDTTLQVVARQARVAADGVRTNALAVRADGAYVAVATWEPRILVLDGATLQPVWQQVVPQRVPILEFAPAGLLHVGHLDGRLQAVDPGTGAVRAEAAMGGVITDLSLSADGRWFAVTADQTDLAILEIDTLREVRRLPVRGFAVALSPDGRRLAVGGSYQLRIFDAKSARELLTLEAADLPISDVWFSGDGPACSPETTAGWRRPSSRCGTRDRSRTEITRRHLLLSRGRVPSRSR